MTDVATTGGAVAPAAQSSNDDETWLGLILHEMEILDQVLTRTGDEVSALAAVAGEVDRTLTRVDEESERVEAPTETRAATDAANTVGRMIAKLTVEVGQHCRTTRLLLLTGRQGMKPAQDVQDRQRAIGAGPKLLASAGK